MVFALFCFDFSLGGTVRLEGVDGENSPLPRAGIRFQNCVPVKSFPLENGYLMEKALGVFHNGCIPLPQQGLSWVFQRYSLWEGKMWVYFKSYFCF